MNAELPAGFTALAADARAGLKVWWQDAPLRASAFLATIAICVFYEAYRYPLKINESVVSPTYADTPFSLQAGKYVLLGLVVLALLAGLRAVRWRQNQLLLLFCVYATARCAAGALSAHDTASLDVIAPFAVGGIIAVLLQRRVPGSLAYLLAAAVMLLHAVANIAEIGLYFAIGRLPALAYAGNAIKRFGGLWDDPNSVALVSALFLVYLLVARRRDYLFAAAALMNIAVSVSYSGPLALAVGYCAILIMRRSRFILVAVPVFVVAAIALFVFPVESLPVGGNWLATKQKSASLRLTTTTTLPLPDNVIVGDSVPKGTENSIAAILASTGIIGLGMFLAWIVIAWRSTQKGRPWAIPILAGFFAAALVVPFVTTFPTGTLFALFLVQVSGGYEYESPADDAPGRKVEPG